MVEPALESVDPIGQMLSESSCATVGAHASSTAIAALLLENAQGSASTLSLLPVPPDEAIEKSSKGRYDDEDEDDEDRVGGPAACTSTTAAARDLAALDPLTDPVTVAETKDGGGGVVPLPRSERSASDAQIEQPHRPPETSASPSPQPHAASPATNSVLRPPTATSSAGKKRPQSSQPLNLNGGSSNKPSQQQHRKPVKIIRSSRAVVSQQSDDPAQRTPTIGGGRRGSTGSSDRHAQGTSPPLSFDDDEERAGATTTNTVAAAANAATTASQSAIPQLNSSYRVTSAGTQRSSRISANGTPTTRATSPAGYLSSSSLQKRMPPSETMAAVDPKYLVDDSFEMLPEPPDGPVAFLSATSSGEALSSPSSPTAAANTREMQSQVRLLNSHLSQLPELLRSCVAVNTQRNRELLRTANVFLAQLRYAIETARPTPNPTPKASSSSHASSSANDLLALVGSRSLVQVIPNVAERVVDIARQDHDGTFRISLSKVPLSADHAVFEVAERKRALEIATESVDGYLREWEASLRDGSRVGSPVQPQSTSPAVGSPMKAVQQKQEEESNARPQSQQQRHSDAPRAALRASASTKLAHLQAVQRRAFLDFAAARENQAIVQCCLDLLLLEGVHPGSGVASSSTTSATSTAKTKSAKASTPQTTPPQQQQQSSGNSAASTAPLAPHELSRELDAIRAEVQQNVDQVDRQLRSLRHVPSHVAATKAHQEQRQVTVDKEELLLRDRHMFRMSLDVIDKCVAERRVAKAVLDDERRSFSACAAARRSTTEGRDDELVRKNHAHALMRGALEAALAENFELKGMIQALESHVADLELRIAVSRREPPLHALNATQRAALLTATMGASTTSPSRGESPSQRLTSSVSGSSAISPLPSCSRCHEAHSSRAAAAASSVSEQPPSSDIFRVSPNLSVTKRLTRSAEGELVSRLHDEAVELKRYCDADQRSKARRRSVSPSTCSKHHVLPAVDTLFRLNDSDEVPTAEQLTQRLYVERKHRAEQLHKKLLDAVLNAEAAAAETRPLKLKNKKLQSIAEEQQNVDWFYRKTVEDSKIARQKLFQLHVLDKEAPYAPKKVSASEIQSIVDRLGSGK